MTTRIFSSRYINVTFGLISGQMSVSHRQYFLIRHQIILGDKFLIHLHACQQFPQSLRSLKRSSLNRDITIIIYHYRRITYHKKQHRPCGYGILRRGNVSCKHRASGRGQLRSQIFPYRTLVPPRLQNCHHHHNHLRPHHRHLSFPEQFLVQGVHI